MPDQRPLGYFLLLTSSLGHDVYVNVDSIDAVRVVSKDRMKILIHGRWIKVRGNPAWLTQQILEQDLRERSEMIRPLMSLLDNCRASIVLLDAELDALGQPETLHDKLAVAEHIGKRAGITATVESVSAVLSLTERSHSW